MNLRRSAILMARRPVSMRTGRSLLKTLNVGEVAKLLHVKPYIVVELIRDGHIQTVGSDERCIPESEVTRLLAPAVEQAA